MSKLEITFEDDVYKEQFMNWMYLYGNHYFEEYAKGRLSTIKAVNWDWNYRDSTMNKRVTRFYQSKEREKDI
jgi:hypothetical protein